MMMRRTLPLALLLFSAPLAAQTATPGYSPAAARAEHDLEARATATPDSASARRHSHKLSKESHIAGTPAQARTRDYVINAMKSWGLQTEVRAYDVWMPHTTEIKLWRVSPDTLSLDLAEKAVAGDSTSGPAFEKVIANGYSGTGDVTAPVVYVNYGLIEDYKQLDSIGVSVKGKIAIARYGHSYRGIKAREAEKRGAVGLIIYSDPADDGFTRGDVYPEGPMRSETGVQRGSVMNDNGDPSTPGYPSHPGAKRIPLGEMQVPHIPVIPASYRNASQLLEGVRGAAIPQTWQGGLAFRYHVGPGPVAARIVVRSDSATNAIKHIYDTFGIVRGSEFPDEIVLIGGHRDAWGPGAADNVSGTVSVLEAARAVAAEVKKGWHPKRTLLFATWDAEEWGLLGSTEFVEDDSLRLEHGAVAYFNQDGAADGPNFGGAGSPSLRPTLRDVTREIPDPSGGGSIYAVWRKTEAVPDSAEPKMGDPGGGSDFAGFYNHLGIPIIDWGYHGRGGVYHSQFDSYHWMSTFGDPTYAYHAAAGRVATAMVLRLADADVLPYDYAEFARDMRTHLATTQKNASDRKWSLDASALSASIDALEHAATGFAAARDSVLAKGTPSKAVLVRTNASLLLVERALTRPQGLKTRPWFRNLIYAADEDNGYSNMVFPSINEATRAGDQQLAQAEMNDLATRFTNATDALIKATAALR
ncbi:MAG: M20/M25/M40 family metallo-hydrolase [Gemmatimonadaceae bacterium]|nr:M20/M25/M40 family metallo-hydrolase [Gemmatimonadaceae bacterium]